ncbi:MULTISPECIES: hypothetical protein [Flavobacterium]|jgi:hypothetical protein|uniref:Ankyrin repeat protein n=1 Tax=Flavobacterium keumense TaxID=1306518 RepID=A0ABY8N5G0_9FLAO|nr:MULTISPECIES: hypothetical protein [Flavobacterium]WGK94875.1 hypothetical protein MG292_01220 [Flavobacterium keumense]
MRNNYIIILIILVFLSCNKDKEICKLLNSNEKDEIIEGAFEAANSGDSKYIPLLLKNANDARRSTNLKFKGYSVYQAKMLAIKRISKKEPSRIISRKPDSLVIKYYILLFSKSER